MVSLVKKALEPINRIMSESFKMENRFGAGEYVNYCNEEVPFVRPLLWVGVALFVIHMIVVRILYLRLDRDRQLWEHVYFRTNTGFCIGLLLMFSYSFITIGLYHWNFVVGLVVNYSAAVVIFFWLLRWLRKDFEKQKMTGEFVEVDVEDYYMDFQNTSSLSVTVAAFVQLTLLSIVTISLFEAYGSEGPPWCLFNIFAYIVGAIIQFLYIYHHFIWSLLEKENFWSNIISKDQDCLFVALTDTDNRDGYWKKVTKVKIKYRQCLHFFVNGMIMLWVLVLIPIQITSAEFLQDIVLNMVATYFITELDDLQRDEYMVISTNPDRFTKSSNATSFYKWTSKERTASEMRQSVVVDFATKRMRRMSMVTDLSINLDSPQDKRNSYGEASSSEGSDHAPVSLNLDTSSSQNQRIRYEEGSQGPNVGGESDILEDSDQSNSMIDTSSVKWA